MLPSGKLQGFGQQPQGCGRYFRCLKPPFWPPNSSALWDTKLLSFHPHDQALGFEAAPECSTLSISGCWLAKKQCMRHVATCFLWSPRPPPLFMSLYYILCVSGVPPVWTQVNASAPFQTKDLWSCFTLDSHERSKVMNFHGNHCHGHPQEPIAQTTIVTSQN